MGSANDREQGALIGKSPLALAPDAAGYQEKARAQQLYAMNQHVAGQERTLRIQVLGLALGISGADPVKTAEEFWAFVTAGDPAPPEDDTRL